MDNNQIPRRSRMDQWNPAELSIYNVIQEVESLGAHPKLTATVTTLLKAKDLLADYFDDKEWDNQVLDFKRRCEESCVGLPKNSLDESLLWIKRYQEEEEDKVKTLKSLHYRCAYLSQEGKRYKVDEMANHFVSLVADVNIVKMVQPFLRPFIAKHVLNESFISVGAYIKEKTKE